MSAHVVDYRGYEISCITTEECEAILDSGPFNYAPRGLYIVQETVQIPGTTRGIQLFVAIDNSTGDAWTEEFHSVTVARQWLAGLLDTDEALAKDYRCLKWSMASIMSNCSDDEATAIREWVVKIAPWGCA